MEFALTDEQRALRDTVRSFLRDRFPTSAVREVYDDPAGDGNPAPLWKSVGEQGWLAVLVPEEHDGIGLGLVDASVIAREFGAGVVPGPWAVTLLGGEAIRLAGSPEQQAEWLPKLAAGETPFAIALGGPDGAGSGVSVDWDTLTGTVTQVEYAQLASALVVATDGGGLWLVDPGTNGVTITPTPPLDRTTRMASVAFDGAAAQRLPGSSPAVLQSLLDRAAALAASDLAGIARRALTDTVEYDKTRVQFGRPVGSFQAIKHALADLHVAVTMAEHGALYAAYALDTERPDATLAVSVAKSKAGEAARNATAAMIQYFGGIGYTWEHDAHFYFKRAKRLEVTYGDVRWHRERIASIVIDGAA